MTAHQCGNQPLAAAWLQGPKGRALAIDRCTRALRECRGNIQRTAQYLSIGRSTLNRWIQSTRFGAPELPAELEAIRREIRAKEQRSHGKHESEAR